MEWNELLLKRRSCRSYAEGQSMDPGTMEEILDEVLFAPSWCNFEGSRSYAAVSPEKKKEVLAALPDFNQKNAKNAAAYIVTTYKKGLSGFINGKTDALGNQWGAYDLGLHDAYLVLALRNRGFDSLIMGLRDENRLREIFASPEDEVIMSVIAAGKHDSEPVLRPRKALQEVAKIR